MLMFLAGVATGAGAVLIALGIVAAFAMRDCARE
jgi:hypothetical protein